MGTGNRKTVFVFGGAFVVQGSKDRQGNRSVRISLKCSIRDPEQEQKIFFESVQRTVNFGYQGRVWNALVKFDVSNFRCSWSGPGFFKIFVLGPWIPVWHIQNSSSQTTRRKPLCGRAVVNLKPDWYQTVDRCLENSSYHVSHMVWTIPYGKTMDHMLWLNQDISPWFTRSVSDGRAGVWLLDWDLHN